LFQKALAINPKLTPSLAGLGRAYLRQGKTEEAISYLERAVALQPDSANYHYQLGQAYLKKGMRAEAQKQFAEQHKLQAAQVEKQAERLSGRLPPPAEPAP
jgi:tetratricopeptide (TPR) repeat protein